MEYIILFFIAGISYALGYISHNHTLTHDYLELQKSYDQLYALDNETISQLQQTINRLEKEIANRGTND